MANECSHKWHSTLFYYKTGATVDDGRLEIDPEGGSGALGGKHKKSGKTLNGLCEHNGTHRITLVMPRDEGGIFVYRGNVSGPSIIGQFWDPWPSGVPFREDIEGLTPGDQSGEDADNATQNAAGARGGLDSEGGETDESIAGDDEDDDGDPPSSGTWTGSQEG